jgi:hypothetical protein
MCESMACFQNKMPMTFLFCSRGHFVFMRRHCGCKSNVDTLWLKDLSVDMFAKYGSTKDASITVLKDAHTGYSCLACHGYWTCEMWERTESHWNYTFGKMQQKGCWNRVCHFSWGLVCIHESSNSLKGAIHVHEYIVQTGFECNLFVHNWLIIMYVKLWQSEGWLDMVSKMVIGVED